MDLFIVSENDIFEIENKAKALGVLSVGSHGVKAKGYIWYEEEGEAIADAKLVVVFVDRDMLDCQCCGYCINFAKNHDIPVWAFFQTKDKDIESEFDSRWSVDEKFYEAGRLLGKIIEFQTEKKTASGLSIRVNSYFGAEMYDEALQECEEFVRRFGNEMPDVQSSNFILFLDAACHIFEKMAMIYTVQTKYREAESVLKKELNLIDSERVIWAHDKKLYLKYLLYALYSDFLNDTDCSKKLKEELRNKSAFGTDEENKRKNTGIIIQKAAIFFEKCIKLQKKISEEKTGTDQKLDDDTYRLIGEHIRASVLLFNKLVEYGADEGFGECLRKGYERLAEYCKIIGAKDIALKCLNEIAVNMNLSKGIEKTVNENGDFNLKCIKAYLGETLPDSGYFDVFISHKTEDGDKAYEIYRYLKEKGKEPFFDRVSLRNIGESNYRKSIFNALDKSTHFVLVVSDLEYLNSKWVEQEYNMFCDEKTEGRKNGNVILVFPEDVCKKVYARNKKDLPIQLRSFEIIPYEKFADSLSDYII